MLEFTQKQFELEISQVLENGDITKISNGSGIGYSYVDQQLNPNDERKSYLFGALQIICALDEISAERGEKIFQIFAKYRDLSKKQSAFKTKDLRAETGKLNKEIAELICANLEDKPFEVQMSELLDVERQLAEVKSAYIEDFNRQKQTSPTLLRVAR